MARQKDMAQYLLPGCSYNLFAKIIEAEYIQGRIRSRLCVYHQ